MKVKADGYFAIIPEWVLYADISPAAVRVYGVLNRYANSDGKCIPSRKSISQKARIGLSTVDRSIDELVALGAVAVRHRTSESGDPTSNEYTVIVNRGLPTENRPPIEFEQRGLFKSDNLTIVSRNQSQESDTSSSDDDGFAEFWKIYPRKVGKGAALKAFKKHRKKTALDLILNACSLYAIERKGKDVEYTAHPATWLNQERWHDDQDPAHNPDHQEPEIEIPRWEPCGDCNNGWITEYDDKGYEYARPCICRP